MMCFGVGIHILVLTLFWMVVQNLITTSQIEDSFLAIQNITPFLLFVIYWAHLYVIFVENWHFIWFCGAKDANFWAIFDNFLANSNKKGIWDFR